MRKRALRFVPATLFAAAGAALCLSVAGASPDPDSIPWLLVNITSHGGRGVLSPATNIQRLNTKGGKAPSSGCDASQAGQELRVPYSADYLFYAPK